MSNAGTDPRIRPGTHSAIVNNSSVLLMPGVEFITIEFFSPAVVGVSKSQLCRTPLFVCLLLLVLVLVFLVFNVCLCRLF